MKKSYWHQNKVVNTFTKDKSSVALSRFLYNLPDHNLMSVLDVGCGGGRNTEMIFREGFKIYACDNSIAMIKQTKKRMSRFIPKNIIKSRIIKANMVKLPFKNNFFDIVVSNGVFHNAISVEMLNKAIKETSRVLKKEGKLYLNIFYEFKNTTNVQKTKYPNVYSTNSGLKMTLLNSENILRILKNYRFKLYSDVKIYKKKLDVGNRGVFRAIFIK
jgi:ubiquinone/menaquinone biosynthesis C-methylase UbiE